MAHVQISFLFSAMQLFLVVHLLLIWLTALSPLQLFVFYSTDLHNMKTNVSVWWD